MFMDLMEIIFDFIEEYIEIVLIGLSIIVLCWCGIIWYFFGFSEMIYRVFIPIIAGALTAFIIGQCFNK